MVGRASRARRGRAWLVHRVLGCADLLGLSLAFVLAQLALGERTRSRWHFSSRPSRSGSRPPSSTGSTIVTSGTRLTTVDDFARVFHLVTVGLWLMLALGWLLGVVETTVPGAVVFWALSIVMIVMLRAVARLLACRSPLYVQRAIIVGAGDVGQTVARRLLAHPEYGVELLGFSTTARPSGRTGSESSADSAHGDVTAIVSRSE